MFGGTSGVGKSLLLLNMALRGAQNTMIRKAPYVLPGDPLIDEPPESVYLYVTMENYVYETWTRMYCAMFGKTKNEMLQELYDGETTPRTISEEIKAFLAPRRSSIQIEYFPANSISPATIGGLIRKYNEEPRVRSVKAVYVDYLDLLLPDEQREFYRLDLGEITSSLKTLAANFEIPIITATQLNREAYRTNKKGEIGSAMISESMQKLFIADFSAMMFRDDISKKDAPDRPTDDIPKKVALKVDKNRDGKTGCTHIYFDYPRSRFITQEEFVEEYEKLLAI
jgi:replicative DNA helicase